MKNDKLELLALAKDYQVTKSGRGYDVVSLKANLEASIEGDGEITYFVNECYNSSGAEIIDVEALLELKKLCELMIKE